MKQVCNPPYMPFGTSCCLDRNANSICDSDDAQAAVPSQKETLTCNAPYIIRGNECCLDQNENKICDTDEKTEEKPVFNTTESKLSINKLQNAIVSINVSAPCYSPGFKDCTTLGSGFFIDPRGYFVTNAHVIEPYVFFCKKDRPCSVEIKTFDGNRYTADLTSFEYDWDFAMLKVNTTKTDFVYLNLSKSGGEIGENIYLIGSPMGLDFSVSKGIISQKKRPSLIHPEDAAYDRYMQTDSPVNPGNSGGPFISEKGEVVAMASFGYLLLDGLNFGLESKQVKSLIDDTFFGMEDFQIFSRYQRWRMFHLTSSGIFNDTEGYPYLQFDRDIINISYAKNATVSDLSIDPIYNPKIGIDDIRLFFNMLNKRNESSDICFRIITFSNTGFITSNRIYNENITLLPRQFLRVDKKIEVNILTEKNHPQLVSAQIIGCDSKELFGSVIGPSTMI